MSSEQPFWNSILCIGNNHSGRVYYAYETTILEAKKLTYKMVIPKHKLDSGIGFP